MRIRNPVQTAAVGALALAAAVLRRPEPALGAAALLCAAEILAGLRGRPGPRWVPSRWPVDGPSLTILYDAHCRLCVASRTRLERWATADRLRFVPIQDPEARSLAPGKTAEDLQGEMHVVEDGRVYGGADGWFRILRLAPLELAWLRAAPRFLAASAYRLIARNRYRWFGRIECEEGSCEVHRPR